MAPDDLEAIANSLDAVQLAHIGASWVARASERRAEKERVADPPPLTDPETATAFALLEPLAARLTRHAERSRSLGIDDDIIGCSIARELMEAGHDEHEVASLIRSAGIDWHPRTTDERLVAAAADLLAMGMEPETVRAAFAARAALTGSEVS